MAAQSKMDRNSIKDELYQSMLDDVEEPEEDQVETSMHDLPPEVIRYYGNDAG